MLIEGFYRLLRLVQACVQCFFLRYGVFQGLHDQALFLPFDALTVMFGFECDTIGEAVGDVLQLAGSRFWRTMDRLQGLYISPHRLQQCPQFCGWHLYRR